MSILLVGGGPDTVTTPVIFDRFVHDVRRRTGSSTPRITVVLFDREGSSEYFLPAYLQPLQSRMPCQLTPVLLHSNEPADPASFDDVDAIVVGGGPAPEYLAGLLDSAAAIRTAVAAGAPYLGFSPGR